MSRYIQNTFAAVVAIVITATTLSSVVSVPAQYTVAIASAPVLA